jgi:magnesium transporter
MPFQSNGFLSNKRKINSFKKLSSSKQAYMYRALTRYYKKKIINTLEENELINMFKYMDDDEIVDCLQLLPKEKSEKIIKKSSQEVQYLLKFNPSKAGGKMNTNYIIINYDNTIKQVQEKIKKREKYTDKTPIIVVVKNKKILGEIKIFKLLTHDENTMVEKLVSRVPVIKPNSTDEEIIKIFNLHPVSKVIIAEKGDVIGIVHSEDILSNTNEYTFGKVYKIFGLKTDENVMDPFTVKMKNRLGWLSINLITAIVVGIIVTIFEKTIAAHVIIAAFLPIIANIGGNSGTQTLAVMIRGITLNEIALDKVWKPLTNEVLNGIFNGLFIGLLITIVTYLVYGTPILGLIASASLMITLASAGFIGSVIPLIMKKFNFDPASASSIFITTSCDIIGFFSFLILASIFA